MEVKRRTIFAAGIAALGVTMSGQAISCSITASREPSRFSDRACQRVIREFVRMLNEAPSMDINAVETWLEQNSISLDSDLLWSGSQQTDAATFLRTYRVSDGKLDPKPIRLTEIELVRQRANLASYAFTLRRYSHHAADPEGCNGLFVHDEYWGEEEAAYIAAFKNNQITNLREFPEWFAGDRSV